jgi:TetR/AcrR family transcriptional regulator, regulator of autoinduction and epiphytic fitness
MPEMSRAGSAGTRTYVSPKREEQAKATRRAILEAAQRLFVANGYGATSIRAIAEEAGVAVQTVYAVFGNKRQLVIELVENAVTGDDDSAAVTERSEAQAIRAEPSARRRAQLDAALSRKITERLLPVFKITSDAAAVDPDFAELNRAMIARRRAEMIDAATLLAGDGGLRLSPDDAAASLLVLYSPHVAQILTEHLGWSYDRYETWLADAIERLVLNADADAD